ncbi:hypothetical protein, conserved [Eimeria praecox]|uniref:Uncharacterized protein n=1 Tax=Eimeria praecox TaxID=51316 RepID=U6H7T4_9EIME|nr:hypothetical protein, conserved [Eimeria praecox]
MRAGEGEEHDFLRAEQAANITGPHPAGNELYSMISHLSNLLSEKYPHDGDKVNEARLDSRPASFGAVGVAPPPCSKGNEDRSPKRSDSGWQQGSQFPAAWESGESQGSITGVKSAQERDETVRQPNSTEARQSDPYLDGQPASSRPQILATKRFPDTLGKASGAKCVTTSSKETPRAIASYPRPQRSTGEQPELLASRGTFEQAMPENNPLLDKFLSGAHGIAPFPAEADVGEEAQEIQEVGTLFRLLSSPLAPSACCPHA